MKLWSKFSSAKTVLVLDISSGSVGAGLIKLQPRNIPLVLNTLRVPLYLKDKPDSNSIEKALLRNIKGIIQEIGNSSVDTVLVSFSSPWITSRLRTYVQKSEKPFLVNRKHISNILKEEEENFKNDLEKRYIEKSEIFGSKITNITLNGYESNIFASQQTNDLEIQFMMYAGQKSSIDNIEREITNLIGVKNDMIFENFMFVFMKVFTRAFQNMHSALLVNMSNEALDLLLVKKSYPLVSISLPFGPAYIARAIQKKMNVPLEIAYSYISLFSDGALNSDTRRKFEELFRDIETEWTSSWERVTSEIPKDQVIPYKIFLIGSAQNESIIKTLLSGTFNNHKVEQVGKNSNLVKLISGYIDEVRVDERISILAAYSNIAL